MQFTATAPDLVLQGVAHTHKSALSRPVVALTSTDLTIDGGAFVALVGPTGSGKTTLLEIIAGRRLPSEGKVLLAGEPVAGPGRRGVVIKPSSAADLVRKLEDQIAVGSDLLVLDEPFAGVPQAERERLQEELHAIWRRTGKTIVVASHTADDAAPLATRVITLEDGEVVADVHVDFAVRFAARRQVA
jgi:taurine transport system ATP-binding protein